MDSKLNVKSMASVYAHVDEVLPMSEHGEYCKNYDLNYGCLQLYVLKAAQKNTKPPTKKCHYPHLMCNSHLSHFTFSICMICNRLFPGLYIGTMS